MCAHTPALMSECAATCLLGTCFCVHGCNADALAAKFAFVPPFPVTYAMQYTNKTTWDDDDDDDDDEEDTHARKNGRQKDTEEDDRRTRKTGRKEERRTRRKCTILVREELKEYVSILMRTFKVEALHTKHDSYVPLFFKFYDEDVNQNDVARKQRPTILWSHGNATDAVHSLPLLLELSKRLEVNVCIYEYTGYVMECTGDMGVEACGFCDTAAMIDDEPATQSAARKKTVMKGSQPSDEERKKADRERDAATGSILDGEVSSTSNTSDDDNDENEKYRRDGAWERRSGGRGNSRWGGNMRRRQCRLPRPGIARTLADIDAAFAHLVNELGIPASSIIIYGQSIGTGPSVYLAAKCSRARATTTEGRGGGGGGEEARDDRPLGLVLHSGLASGLRVIGGGDSRCAPVNALKPCDVFVNVDIVGDVDCPCFVIHGKEDEEIHWTHSGLLYENLPASSKYPPWFADGLGHNDIIEHSTAEYFERLSRFIRFCEDRRERLRTISEVPSRRGGGVEEVVLIAPENTVMTG